jgi:hypothetical protein
VAQQSILKFLCAQETKYEISGKYQAQIGYNPQFAEDRSKEYDTSADNLHQQFLLKVVATLRVWGLKPFVDSQVLVEQADVLYRTQQCPIAIPQRSLPTNRSRSASPSKVVSKAPPPMPRKKPSATVDDDEELTADQEQSDDDEPEERPKSEKERILTAQERYKADRIRSAQKKAERENAAQEKSKKDKQEDDD